MHDRNGGPGGDLTSVCLVKEEVAKVSESAALLAANNSFGLILPILNFGSGSQYVEVRGVTVEGGQTHCVGIAGTPSKASTGKPMSAAPPSLRTS